MTEENETEQFLEVGGVLTPVLKLGKLTDGESSKTDTPRILMLIIPGNPGIPHFYTDFMKELYAQSEARIPVWALGHAGHTQPPGQSLTLSDVVSTNDKLFGLEAQIAHKVAFIQEHVPDDVSLILIGHSIGCYMILNLLDQLPAERVVHSFMLFPTIERMALTPSGKRLTPVFNFARWMIVFFALVLSYLPISIKKSLIKLMFRSIDLSPCSPDALLKAASPWTANFTTYLAKQEMVKVDRLQRDLVQKHRDKTSWYYGASDHWCPPNYHADLVAEFPLVDARLCESNFKHAFVLDEEEGQCMAQIVWEWANMRHRSLLAKVIDS